MNCGIFKGSYANTGSPSTSQPVMLAMASAATATSGTPMSNLAALPSGGIPAFRVIIDLRHPKFAIGLFGLHYDIDKHFKQRANIAARQIGATFAFLNQQGQLLERQFG